LGHNVVFLLLSFLVIIVGSELFTNGVEWLGVRLRLSEGAVGSVLAAVGTALPETLIPFVALVLFRGEDSHEIGVGAILGAPFMLSTLAFFVTALAAWGYRGRREQSWRLLINRKVAGRDLGFFLPLYAAAIAVSFSPIGHWGRYLVAVSLLLAYGYYVYLNLRETAEGSKEEPLMLNLVWAALPLLPPADREAHQVRRESIAAEPPRLRAVAGQVLLATSLIIGGAYIFVDAVREISAGIGFPPLVIALIIAPLATELPEKLNSVIWVRQGKDTLALGNISGAMVFQATFPVTLGILATPWHFGGDPVGRAALLSAMIALGSALLVRIAIGLGRRETIAPWPLAVGLPWWLLFLGFVLKTVILPRG
jgi:cation:H+ antiporter